MSFEYGTNSVSTKKRPTTSYLETLKKQTTEILDVDSQDMINSIVKTIKSIKIIDIQEIEDNYSDEICKEYQKNYQKLIDRSIAEIEKKDCSSISTHCLSILSIIEEIELKNEIKPSQMSILINSITNNNKISQKDVLEFCLGNKEITSPGIEELKSII